jgi:hypothetical protein
MKEGIMGKNLKRKAMMRGNRRWMWRIMENRNKLRYTLKIRKARNKKGEK